MSAAPAVVARAGDPGPDGPDVYPGPGPAAAPVADVTPPTPRPGDDARATPGDNGLVPAPEHHRERIAA